MLPRSQAFARALALILFAATASTASAAQGLSMAWNRCLGDPSATQNATFACNTNLGSHVIYGSFRLASPMSIVIGIEMMVDLQVEAPALPPWWQLYYQGSCRQSSLSMQTFPDPSDLACLDWAEGLSIGGLGGYCTSANVNPNGCGVPGQPANRARIKMITAVAPNDAQNLVADQDYFGFGLQISHTKTVGEPSCAGCTTPACIVFNSANVVARDNVEMRFISAPVGPGSSTITWLGGGAGGQSGCYLATPAKKSTWGAVKALYR